MNNDFKQLSHNIAAYRKQRGLTQEALAEQLGISFQAVSKWENEQSAPDIMFLPVLAEIFGVSIDALFGREKVPVAGLPWEDDDTLRGVVYQGHTLLTSYDDLKNFTFKVKGPALHVISYCNIECSEIQEGAEADCNIYCSGDISGGAAADCDLHCKGVQLRSVTAGCDITINGDISGGVQADGDITVTGEISGAVCCDGHVICYNKS